MKIILLCIIISAISFGQANIAVERWSVPQEVKSILSYFPKGVNTPYIGPDGNQLYFESNNQIYYIEKNDSNWSAPKIIIINGNNYFTNPKISQDNKRLFLIKNENSRRYIFYIERENKYHAWSEIKNCGNYINNDSTFIEDYVLQNDSTLLLRIGYGMYYSIYEKNKNGWGPLTKSRDFYDNFYPGNFGGTFINPIYTKVYHTSLFTVITLIDGLTYDFLKYNLVVRNKDFQNHFGQDLLLNINSNIDSVYSKKTPKYNYFALSPSVTKNGKTLFFAVKYADTTRIYSSNMIVDENGIIVSVLKNKNNVIPSESLLYQNYPNPFNPTTTIEFTLAKNTRARLNIYNSLGQLLETILDKELLKGDHKIIFDGSNYSSGIYFYQLITESYCSAKKFTLLK